MRAGGGGGTGRGRRTNPNSWPVCLGMFLSLCLYKTLPPHYVCVHMNVYTTSIYSSSLPICLCCCSHVWIFVQPTCKSKVFLQPGLEQHLCHSHYVIPCSSSKAPWPPNWKTEVDVRPTCSLLLIHCKAWKSFPSKEGKPQPCSFYDLGRNKICFHVSLIWKMTRIQRWLGKMHLGCLRN